jgi:hypothetical protein
VDDPHRKPGDRDRDALVARVERAADHNLIGSADRDIRLRNIASAQSMAELDLMARDLDQLEAALPQPAAPTPGPSLPMPPPVADEIAEKAVDVAKSTARSIGVVTVVILAFVLVGAGASALLAFRSSDDSSTGELFEPEPIPSVATEEPVDVPSGPSPSDPGSSGTAYALTGAGIRSFLAEYRATFDTTLVVDLTMYDDYAIVQVPQAGTHRHAGFLYRPADGWQEFGGVTANFPGAVAVDLRRLAVPALVRNIARARKTLGVEDPTTTYAIVRQYSPGDEVPSVDIHVSNDFGESGYLATTLDGTVERAYPYDQ